jgi:predicted AlkP superfamily pyrophosphatase or phosphodiesterase
VKKFSPPNQPALVGFSRHLALPTSTTPRLLFAALLLCSLFGFIASFSFHLQTRGVVGKSLVFDFVPAKVPNVTRRVFIIGIDGIGTLPAITLGIPNLHSLIKSGFYTFGATTVFPSLSVECWNSLFHGVSPFVHGRQSGIKDDWIPDNSTWPSIFRIASEAGLSGVSIGSWPPIQRFIESNLPNQHKYVSESDQKTAQIFQSFFQDKGSDASLIFTDFDECDVAGHKKGYFSDDHKNCLVYIDRLIGDMLTKIRKLPGDNFFIVTTDHGGGGLNPFMHGSADPRDMTIFWACSGPGIPQIEETHDPVSILDTPVVAAKILRLRVPPIWEGHLPAQLKAAL